VAAGCGSSPPCRIPSPCRPSLPTMPAPAPPRRPAPPHPRPPHSRSPRLSPSLDAAPDTPRRPPAPQPHPSARVLTASPWRRRMARGQRAITVPTLAFAPVTQAIPGVRLEPAGEAAFRPPASRDEGTEGAAFVPPMRHDGDLYPRRLPDRPPAEREGPEALRPAGHGGRRAPCLFAKPDQGRLDLYLEQPDRADADAARVHPAVTDARTSWSRRWWSSGLLNRRCRRRRRPTSPRCTARCARSPPRRPSS
jgi:hypothetical protein